MTIHRGYVSFTGGIFMNYDPKDHPADLEKRIKENILMAIEFQITDIDDMYVVEE